MRFQFRMTMLAGALLLTVGMGNGAWAQAGAPAAATTATVDPAKAYDSELSSFESEFVGAARAMPAEKYSFTPESLHIPGAKFDGVRTFAAEVTHVTQANYSIYAAVMGKKPDVDVKAIGALTDKEQILAAMLSSFAFAHKAIATITPANQDESIGHGMTRGALAAYGPIHGFDHYGQMVEYLRMNGIVPPASSK